MRALLIVQLENGFVVYPADHMQFQLTDPGTARMIPSLRYFEPEAMGYFGLETTPAPDNRWTFTTGEVAQGTQEIAREMLRPEAVPANPAPQLAGAQQVQEALAGAAGMETTLNAGIVVEHQRQMERVRRAFEIQQREARQRRATEAARQPAAPTLGEMLLQDPIAVDPAELEPTPAPPPVWEVP